MKNKNALIIFVKEPIAGKVKTRLATCIGDEKACQVYIKLLKIIIKQNNNSKQWSTTLYYDPITAEDYFKNKYDVDIYLAQPESGLGERLSFGFKYFFENKYNNVIAIGSDCPAVDSHIIEQAFARLENKSVVFGPAEDGGYYLIGMNKYYPELFEGIDWSTEIVLEQSIEVLKNTKLDYTLLNPLRDIDTMEDLKYYPEIAGDILY